MFGRFLSACSVLGLPLLLAAQTDWESAVSAPGVRLNEIQIIGTHNSYHLEPPAQAMAWKNSEAVRRAAPSLAALAVEYSHRTLTEQLDKLGVRQLEIDLYASDDGRDFPVRHHPVFDERSTVPTLRTALQEIRAWSQAHSRHVPVMVEIELKVRRWTIPEQELDPELVSKLAALPAPREWDAAQFALLEKIIRDEFSAGELLTPDDVRGDAPTLRDAIATRGWPLLDRVRGRVMFTLDNEGEVRDRYLGPAGDGRGKVLFVSVPPEHPAAGWMKLNDPVTDFARIQSLVRRGSLVRTRADEELREARANDGTRRDRAFASGAQFISTDFPEADRRYSDYCVQLPGRIAAGSDPVSPKSR